MATHKFISVYGLEIHYLDFEKLDQVLLLGVEE